ncbi:MAG: oligosaccharide flippase family protein [Rhodospirillales bacterium]|nr:oligosaccharide flippase family protein [Rhodospirillales bacterium]
MIDRLRGGLLGRASWVTLCNVSGMGLAFLAQVLVARALGAEEFGRYALALNWVFLGVMVVRLGLGSVIIRFVATYVAEQSWGLLRGLLRRTLLLQLAVAVAVAALVALLAKALPGLPASWTPGTLALSGLLLALLVVGQWIRDAFFGFQQPVRALINDVLVPKGGLVVLAGLAVVGVFGVKADAEWALGWIALATSCGILLGAALLARALPRERLAHQPRHDSAGWMRVAFPLLVVNAASEVTARADMLVLGSLAPPREAGIYATAVALSSLLGFFQGVAVTTLSPVFAAHHARGERAAMQALLTRGALLVTVLTLPMVAIMVLFGRTLLGFYGLEYQAGFHLLIILAVGHLIAAGTGVVGAVMTMTGQQTLFAGITVGTATVNTLLSIILVGAWGTTGAALATLATAVLRAGALGAAVYSKLGLVPTVFGALLRKSNTVVPTVPARSEGTGSDGDVPAEGSAATGGRA